jgi:hypothetical protein
MRQKELVEKRLEKERDVMVCSGTSHDSAKMNLGEKSDWPEKKTVMKDQKKR